jgi:hypothetical protein
MDVDVRLLGLSMVIPFQEKGRRCPWTFRRQPISMTGGRLTVSCLKASLFAYSYEDPRSAVCGERSFEGSSSAMAGDAVACFGDAAQVCEVGGEGTEDVSYLSSTVLGLSGAPWID